jgi:hypothetical protein
LAGQAICPANTVAPSFLHRYFSGPPLWFGKPLPGHLATVTGHSPEALERTLADADSPHRKSRPRPRIPRKNPFAWRHDLARRIAREALKGTQVRLLAKRYNLRCWDIRFALETARPAISETSLMAGPIKGELAGLVESMIGRGLNGRQIWTELMDHHEYSVTYEAALPCLGQGVAVQGVGEDREVHAVELPGQRHLDVGADPQVRGGARSCCPTRSSSSRSPAWPDQDVGPRLR